MAVRTEAVQFLSCHLCSEDVDEADLVCLYGPQHSGQIDICVGCQQRPIAELVHWIRRKEFRSSSCGAAVRPCSTLQGEWSGTAGTGLRFGAHAGSRFTKVPIGEVSTRPSACSASMTF
jgi:hypothetical protein